MRDPAALTMPFDERENEDDPGGDEVTTLLHAASDGDRAAFDELVPLLYDQLRHVARGILAREGRQTTLSPTGLVHEAWARLAQQERLGARHRTEFFAAAATAMRRALVDHARARRAEKRGGAVHRIPLDDGALDGLVTSLESRSGDLVALDDALVALSAVDARQAQLVELRFFAGLQMNEAAEALGLSLRQAERDWTHARAWLRERMGSRPTGEPHE